MSKCKEAVYGYGYCLNAVKKVYEKKTFLNLCYDLKTAGNFVLPKAMPKF